MPAEENDRENIGFERPQAVSYNTFIIRDNTSEEFEVFFIDLSVTKTDVN